ncbi:MAG: SPASM domain-containing protein [Defluviitaleaceae bacterium]|nr:SPASM domain-containing protein [Defluviitaleaceae bacterium]
MKNRISMDNELLLGLCNDIITMNVKSVYFSGGGEPTLHPYLSEAIQVLHSNGVDIALITNGSNSDIIERNATKLKYVLVHISSHIPKVFESLMNVSDYDSLLLAKKMKAISNVTIGARIVIVEENIDHAASIVEYLLNNKYDYVQCTLGIDYDLQSTYVTQKKADALLNNPIFGDERVMFNKMEKRKSKQKKCQCIIYKVHTVIEADGNVNICPPLSNRAIIGNLNQQNLKDIWNSTTHTDIIRNINSSLHENECCFCRFSDYNSILSNILEQKSNPHRYFL